MQTRKGEPAFTLRREVLLLLQRIGPFDTGRSEMIEMHAMLVSSNRAFSVLLFSGGECLLLHINLESYLSLHKSRRYSWPRSTMRLVYPPKKRFIVTFSDYIQWRIGSPQSLSNGRPIEEQAVELPPTIILPPRDFTGKWPCIRSSPPRYLARFMNEQHAYTVTRNRSIGNGVPLGSRERRPAVSREAKYSWTIVRSRNPQKGFFCCSGAFRI